MKGGASRADEPTLAIGYDNFELTKRSSFEDQLVLGLDEFLGLLDSR